MRSSAWLRDPVAASLALFAGLAVAGFVAIGLGWRVTARTLLLAAQVPAVISGALGGLALVTVGAGLFVVQVGRRLAAVERAETEELLDEASALLAAAKGRRA